MTRPRECEYRVRRHPEALAHAGEFALACGPTCWSWSLSRPALPNGLDSGEPR
jgi:hypothetical protein